MYTNHTTQFDYDSHTRSLFVWDHNILHAVSVRQHLCSRVYGNIRQNEGPWSEWPQIGLNKLILHVEKSQEQHDGIWGIDDFNCIKGIVANAESMQNFIQAIGTQRVKNVSCLSGRLSWIALLLLDLFPAAEHLLDCFPQMFFAITTRIASYNCPNQALELARYALTLEPADAREYLCLPSTTIVKKLYAPALRPRLFSRFCQEMYQNREISREGISKPFKDNNKAS